MHEMKISICSQVKNRKHQLEQTIKSNVDLIKSRQNVEWVIVDMGSNDGIEELIRENMTDELRYYKALEETPYSIPVAKNLSARLSSGDYIFNLDIDNFIGDIVDQIRDRDYQGVCCNILQKGVFGRIGCPRDIFRKVGGYDESFMPAGHHEQDFMERCNTIGFNFHHAASEIDAIPNDKNDTVKNMDNKIPWILMNKINKQKKIINLRNNLINPNRSHARGKFLMNFNNIVELGKEF